MTRVLTAAVALAGLPLISLGEETAVRFTVRPMAAPKPALKFQLLPELRELNAGNAAQNYLRCFMEQRQFFHSKEAVADRARYQTMPLAELPLDKLREYGKHALRQADWAARQDTVDWQDIPHIQHGDLDEVPPAVAPLQVLAAALQVRFRAEVAGRRFDDAIRTAKTMFALARHLGEHPSEVANLVGLWTAHLGLNTLAELVQQPGCPNLYWALTDLPCPLVDVRKGVHGQRTLLAAEMRALHDEVVMTEVEIDKFVDHYCSAKSFAREQAGRPPRNQRAGLEARFKDSERVTAARRRLIEAGFAPTLVSQFSPKQVILLDEKLAYEIERDERIKVLALPLWQIDAPVDHERKQRSDGLFVDVLPDIVKLRRTQGQLEQQIAMLRHVEALRLYVAGHDAKLPAQLTDVTVPLPADPVTGKPFDYVLEGTTVHLRGSQTSNKDGPADNQVHYRVTVQK